MKKWIGPLRLATWGPGILHSKGGAISISTRRFLLSFELHFERRKHQSWRTK